MRGEQARWNIAERCDEGSPPRARGAVRAVGADLRWHGITPACAGSSAWPPSAPTRCWDHPRVRGEQVHQTWSRSGTSGSPPRARGADRWADQRYSQPGITPACAGSRLVSSWTSPPTGDHPRVRGEQACSSTHAEKPWGSPPRARGAGCPGLGRERFTRITPACAGSRTCATSATAARTDHPRVRGEQAPAHPMGKANTGSPPRARGAVLFPPPRQQI